MKQRSDDQLVRDVARRIAEIREATGLTQQELAERLGVSPQWVRKLESGTVNLSLVSLNHLTRALKVPIVEFFSEPLSRARRGRGRPPASASRP